jgi:hypothetical protein
MQAQYTEVLLRDMAGMSFPAERIQDASVLAAAHSNCRVSASKLALSRMQAHYTEVLLRDMAGITFPADRIHSTTVSGEPKASVLAQLAAQHPGAAGYVFVEDKHSTLEKVRGSALSQLDCPCYS